ncbi:peptidoglycan-binding protein [Dickeya fangzhongdai]|uniref:CIS tube protein n=1 Tax=Dickeya fangzhongdai TaxID=1778540 RepID=UPI000EAF88D4|nr:peptidoglycan-binding protein [Dickeya fangzhongdai]AYH49425.1 peptidoglycan-binding protein [Dickeya fangzhongdai]
MQKLTIRTLDKKQQFDVMLNPAGIRHEHGINYSNRSAAGHRALGSLAPRLGFASYQSETLSFEMMIDGTGVVEQPQKPDVAGQITQLKNVVYRYVGDKHEPSVVVLTWGTLSFKGRLTRLAIRYSLFDTAGAPLRATVELRFDNYLDSNEQALRANRSSPDLTHSVVVKQGDTLPQLCQAIYQDSAYYVAVARYNNLTSVRHIVPGTRLYFPPLA